MKKKKLIQEMEDLRNELNLLIAEHGEKSEVVLHCSQELDKLLNKIYLSSDERIDKEEKQKIKKSASSARYFQLLIYNTIDLCS